MPDKISLQARFSVLNRGILNGGRIFFKREGRLILFVHTTFVHLV